MQPSDEKLVYDYAKPEEEGALRRLLREIPLSGFLTVSYEREPNFFLATTIEGDAHDTLVARLEPSQRLVGLASRSVHRAFVNGKIARLGYLSQVRIVREYRGGKGLLRVGFAKLHEKHLSDPLSLYITTIIASNKIARRALAGRRSGVPPYTEQGVISVLLIPLWPREVSAPQRVGIRQATRDDLPAIATCLQKQYATYQFAPVWTAEDLAHPERVRGLRPEDFWVAVAADQVVGCIAIWDQRSFKQNVIRGYGGGLGHLVPTVNWFGRKLGLPPLPRTGEVFPSAYLSHFSANADDPELALALVARGLEEMRKRGTAYATLGLAERNPLCQKIKKAYRHIEYRSVLFTVHWEDGQEAVNQLEDRIAHVEVATL